MKAWMDANRLPSSTLIYEQLKQHWKFQRQHVISVELASAFENVNSIVNGLNSWLDLQMSKSNFLIELIHFID